MPEEDHPLSVFEVYEQPLTPPPQPEMPTASSPSPACAPEPAPATAPALASEAGNTDLDDDILEILGEAPEPETILGTPVHKDIVARWQDILKKGLNKECKGKFFKIYQIPSNCEFLIPPLLNPEAKAALTDPFLKRDSSMVSRQKHLSVAITALTRTLDKLIGVKDSQKQEIIKPISDACRILCDMHHYETMTRKKFVISSINTGMQEILTNATTDKYLFGENMSDKLKTAKTVQRSGEELKNIQRTPNPRNNLNRGNFNTLPQKRPETGRVPTGPRQYWGYQRSRTGSRTAYPHAAPQAPVRLPPPARLAPSRPPPPPPARRAGRR